MLQYKSANPAEFESPIPSATWNSELFHFSDRILAIPELRLGSSFKPTTLIVFSLISIPEKAKQRKSQRVSEAHRALTATSQALTMKNLGGKSNSQMIIISEADSTVRNSEEDDDLDDDGPVDFLSVRDLNVTRYNSAKDLQSLSTYKSVRSVTAENISMCSKISDR